VQFYLGTHHPSWLSEVDVPLFVSRRRLQERRTLPRARALWALDSGGFSELFMYGEWRLSPTEYVIQVRRYREDIGALAWAAPQDWMCEPWLVQKTGLSVEEHQQRTVSNFLDLRGKAPDLPIIPVLQGWSPDSYLECWQMYDKAGVNLSTAPLVGLGSMCRRQNTAEATRIIASLLRKAPLNLHAFGFKLSGLRRTAHRLVSADSMAWSYRARRSAPLVGCTHRSCANCQRWALAWRESALLAILSPKQEVLL
jgi:hypothetical protein